MAGTQGDDGALFQDLYPALRRFAGAIRPAGVDADDLVQEALARTLAIRSLASIENPVAYLRTTMVRVASNLVRSTRRSDVRVRADSASGEVSDVYPSDLDDLMRTSPKARAVLFLIVVEMRSYQEAAEIVGCSEQTARQRASRALRTLRAEVRADMQPREVT
jgi:RNA polymerase sigma-70 factor (ECF subfamily)